MEWVDSPIRPFFKSRPLVLRKSALGASWRSRLRRVFGFNRLKQAASICRPSCSDCLEDRFPRWVVPLDHLKSLCAELGAIRKLRLRWTCRLLDGPGANRKSRLQTRAFGRPCSDLVITVAAWSFRAALARLGNRGCGLEVFARFGDCHPVLESIYQPSIPPASQIPSPPIFQPSPLLGPTFRSSNPPTFQSPNLPFPILPLNQGSSLIRRRFERRQVTHLA